MINWDKITLSIEKWRKIPYPINMSILIISFLIIVLPPCIPLSGIEEYDIFLKMRHDYLQYIIFLFFMSFVLVLSFHIGGRRYIYHGKKYLRNLSSNEKEVLNEYVNSNTTTQLFECTNGTVLGLEYKGILFQASINSDNGYFYPYNIQPWALNYLKRNKQLLK